MTNKQTFEALWLSTSIKDYTDIQLLMIFHDNNILINDWIGYKMSKQINIVLKSGYQYVTLGEHRYLSLRLKIWRHSSRLFGISCPETDKLLLNYIRSLGEGRGYMYYNGWGGQWRPWQLQYLLANDFILSAPMASRNVVRTIPVDNDSGVCTNSGGVVGVRSDGDPLIG